MYMGQRAVKRQRKWKHVGKWAYHFSMKCLKSSGLVV